MSDPESVDANVELEPVQAPVAVNEEGDEE